MNLFNREIKINKLRKCQVDAYKAIRNHFSMKDNERSVLIQLPTGTGKSGLIAIAPFMLSTKRVLVLTPNVKLAKQIEHDLDLTKDGNIYRKLELLNEEELNSLEIYTLRLEGSVSQNDINEHHILIANYHQLQDIEKWFKNDKDAIDLIIIDETHHQEASTYQVILNFFKKAKVIGLTATPFRSDGKKLEGKLIYKYHFYEAIKDNVIRNITIVNISPTEVELSFTDKKAEKFSLEDILELKEEAWFNRGIALSQDCCDSIAQKSKEKLSVLKKQFPNAKHQIIASAISKRHAREYIKTSFEKIGLNVGMVSSDAQDKIKNDKVFEELKYGQIDVIIHIGMLGEGFDHPPLGVAAIFRPYKSLNPYIQFLGRVIRRNDETSHCFVVSHIGLNQIKRFHEFKLFDYEDKKFLEDLFSEKGSEDTFVSNSSEKETLGSQDELSIRETGEDLVDIESQYITHGNEVNTLVGQVEQLSPEQKKVFFEKLGIDIENIKLVIGKKSKRIKPIDKRKASRNLLNEREKSITTDILKELSLKHTGRNFNKMYENFAWIKKKVSRMVNAKLGINAKQRKEINNKNFENIEEKGILDQVKKECLQYFNNKLTEERNK